MHILFFHILYYFSLCLKLFSLSEQNLTRYLAILCLNVSCFCTSGWAYSLSDAVFLWKTAVLVLLTQGERAALQRQMHLYEVLVTSMHVCALHIDPCSPVSSDIVLRSLFEEIMTLSVLKACLCGKRRSRLHHSHEAGCGGQQLSVDSTHSGVWKAIRCWCMESLL